jgi:hypothetical protein
MATKKNKTTTKAKDVINRSNQIGDTLHDVFDESRDIKAGLAAVQAYSLATKTALAQVQYKKLTGKPDKSEFFED